MSTTCPTPAPGRSPSAWARATLANGLVLGLWVIVPGAALLLLGIGGFIRQTRRRD